MILVLWLLPEWLELLELLELLGLLELLIELLDLSSLEDCLLWGFSLFEDTSFTPLEDISLIFTRKGLASSSSPASASIITLSSPDDSVSLSTVMFLANFFLRSGLAWLKLADDN